MTKKKRAVRNKTLTLTPTDREHFAKKLLRIQGRQCLQLNFILNKTIHATLESALNRLPNGFADVIIIDPPYNLEKDFNGYKFSQRDNASYLKFLRSWFPGVVEKLKANGSVYLCGDWKCSSLLQTVLEEHLVVLNRISWQREKGRGAARNWKNGMEDIWFGVKNKHDYYFDVESVKQKRKVIAPYKINGKPKDWEETKFGNYRMTFPSNFWDDISIPYWSMPENTDHPTQKPEKLIAKLILASSPINGIIFDPFLGSGTTSVVAKKLNRQFVGIEMNLDYCLLAEKRIELAEKVTSIQGYVDGVFWERNTLPDQRKALNQCQ